MFAIAVADFQGPLMHTVGPSGARRVLGKFIRYFQTALKVPSGTQRALRHSERPHEGSVGIFRLPRKSFQELRGPFGS